MEPLKLLLISEVSVVAYCLCTPYTSRTVCTAAQERRAHHIIAADNRGHFAERVELQEPLLAVVLSQLCRPGTAQQQQYSAIRREQTREERAEDMSR